MKILLLSAEVAPYAKRGGLADVAGGLPKALRALGHDVRVMMPRYGCIDAAHWHIARTDCFFQVPIGIETVEVCLWQGSMDQVPIFFVDIPWLFGDRKTIYSYNDGDDAQRFFCFCAAALCATEHLQWKPDVVHANDWHTALAPALLRSGQAGTFLSGTASILTIHNLAYQGVVNREMLGATAGLLPPDVGDDWINVMGMGLWAADLLSTVSPTYAHEILTPEYGAGLDGLLRARQDRLSGILNGIDTAVFDPQTDPEIAARYSVDDLAGKVACKTALQTAAGFAVDPKAPMLGMVGRLVNQKGFDLFAAAIETLLNESALQVVVLGVGEPHYHSLLEQLQAHYPGRLHAWLTFDGIKAQHIYAGIDMFLMPSRFEPCGLGQLIAMRYGSVPVVRGTGGLLDTVEEGPSDDPRTGFVFWPYDVGELQSAIRRALQAYQRPEIWRRLVLNDLQVDSSWNRSAQAYVDLYRHAVEIQRA